MAVHTAFDYARREHDSVLVYDLSAWDGETEGMADIETQWRRDASAAHISGTVTVFGPDIALGHETQRHLAREWSDNVDAAGVDRVAFVSEGIKARAVSAAVDVGAEVHVFGSLEEAVEWAQG
ncbi:hypothetical protein [Halobaculum marinum]|uniref:SpoIIAA-like n=1 Tax=Halobaculum marinum TaxID=3031996 RepID=A0ABD5WXS2_9EURY|nr:hypothetical protein [Halobaculum sp. DT55]